MTSFDLRGRDFVIIPPGQLLHLPTPELLKALFGTSLPAPLLATMRRDKRYHFLRTQPIHFAGIKSALRKRQTPFTVAFEERPALPFETALKLETRPYQDEALTRWLAAGSAGVALLPTGAGKTLLAAIAIYQTRLSPPAVLATPY